MKKPKPKRMPVEDEDQSRRFMEEAARATSDGGLSLTEVEAKFDQALADLTPEQRHEG